VTLALVPVVLLGIAGLAAVAQELSERRRLSPAKRDALARFLTTRTHRSA
jgi:hypothetical protein